MRLPRPGPYIDRALAGLAAVLGLDRGGKTVCRVLEQVRPTVTVLHSGLAFRFPTPNRLSLGRARALVTKEPQTVAWIDSFGADEVLYDVGANMGVFTVYAAVRHPGLRVVAFEPAYFNYSLLNASLLLNSLGDRASALCLALSDSDGLGELSLPAVEPGHSLAALAGPGGPVPPEVFRQGAVVLTLDSVIERFGAPVPTRVKIDVDGLELKVVRGARKALRDRRLRSISIEIDEGLAGAAEVRGELEAAGLRLARREGSDPSQPSRVYNCVWERA